MNHMHMCMYVPHPSLPLCSCTCAHLQPVEEHVNSIHGELLAGHRLSAGEIGWRLHQLVTLTCHFIWTNTTDIAANSWKIECHDLHGMLSLLQAISSRLYIHVGQCKRSIVRVHEALPPPSGYIYLEASFGEALHPPRPATWRCLVCIAQTPA